MVSWQILVYVQNGYLALLELSGHIKHLHLMRILCSLSDSSPITSHLLETIEGVKVLFKGSSFL